MPDAITISLDAMSGDRGAAVVVAAADAVLRRDPALRIVLVGDPAELERLCTQQTIAQPRCSIVAASEVVTMDDSPRDAIRRKKDSSMRVAINLLKDGAVDACVSAGNTGALMATAKFVLKTIPGIDRPAIIAEVPAVSGHVFMLDVGANAGCSAEQLFQFAIMGSVIARDVTGIDAPRVALLNIGEEDTKGDDVVRAAAERIGAASGINYIGFVEGNDIHQAKADVVVTDGFSGNIALKTMEGTAAFVAATLKGTFTDNASSKIRAWLARPVLRAFRARIDPRHYNGATFAGLNGIVVKSHGGADAVAFEHAIDTAVVEVRSGVSRHIGQQLERQ
ncbi:MAG: phosphate acyltransferase PlsX [Pseudomonadota bacterium]